MTERNEWLCPHCGATEGWRCWTGWQTEDPPRYRATADVHEATVGGWVPRIGEGVRHREYGTGGIVEKIWHDFVDGVTRVHVCWDTPGAPAALELAALEPDGPLINVYVGGAGWMNPDLVSESKRRAAEAVRSPDAISNPHLAEQCPRCRTEYSAKLCPECWYPDMRPIEEAAAPNPRKSDLRRRRFRSQVRGLDAIYDLAAALQQRFADWGDRETADDVAPLLEAIGALHDRLTERGEL